MAGTIVHLAISNEIKKKYNFSDRFLFGSIMPDIRKRICEDRDATHYIEEIYLGNNNIKRLPNLERYIKENKEKIAQIQAATNSFLLKYTTLPAHFVPRKT